MAEEALRLPPPPPPPVTDDPDEAGRAEQVAALGHEPVKKAARSIRDFFGKKGQSSVVVGVEQDSGVARAGSSKERSVTSDVEDRSARTFQGTGDDDVPLEGDTSAASITIVEPTGSKRKAAASTTSGRKRTQGKKLTDEDAELKAMEAALKKKQKVAGKSTAKKGKNGSLVAADENPAQESEVGKSRF